MIPQDVEFRIAYNPAWAAYDVYIMGKRTQEGRQIIVVKTLESVLVREGEGYPAPTLSLTPHQASAFVAQLSAMGVKPPDVSLAEGKLLATEQHLQDLRALLKLRPREG